MLQSNGGVQSYMQCSADTADVLSPSSHIVCSSQTYNGFLARFPDSTKVLKMLTHPPSSSHILLQPKKVIAKWMQGEINVAQIMINGTLTEINKSSVKLSMIKLYIIQGCCCCCCVCATGYDQSRIPNSEKAQIMALNQIMNSPKETEKYLAPCVCWVTGEPKTERYYTLIKLLRNNECVKLE